MAARLRKLDYLFFSLDRLKLLRGITYSHNASLLNSKKSIAILNAYILAIYSRPFLICHCDSINNAPPLNSSSRCHSRKYVQERGWGQFSLISCIANAMGAINTVVHDQRSLQPTSPNDSQANRHSTVVLLQMHAEKCKRLYSHCTF